MHSRGYMHREVETRGRLRYFLELLNLKVRLIVVLSTKLFHFIWRFMLNQVSWNEQFSVPTEKWICINDKIRTKIGIAKD